MKKKKSSSKTTISDLMEELLMDIFSRLPVKFVIQCKSVSKPWRTLLTHPSFIKLHSNKSKLKNPNLILTSFKQIEPDDPHTCPRSFHSANSEFVDQVVDLNLNLNPEEFSMIPVESCNGLICLSDFQRFMSLWNPSTREHVGLHFPSIPGFNMNRRMPTRLIRVCMGFGYDPVHHDYKVVRILFKSCKCVEVLVYNLSTNSWRTMQAAPSLPISRASGAHLNGVIHWAGRDPRQNVSNEPKIISFDLTTEEFGEIPWSSSLEYQRRHLFVWQGRLAELCTCSPECVELWIMKEYGVTSSWTRMFSFGRLVVDYEYLKFLPLVHLNNGNVLLYWEGLQNLDKVKVLVLYDPANKTARLLHCPLKILYMIPYVESLTSIASLMEGH